MFRRTKNWCIYWAVRGVLRVLAVCPPGRAAAVGRLIGGWVYCAAGGERRRAVSQLRSAFGERFSAHRAAVVVRGLFDQLAHSALELAQLIRRGAAGTEVELDQGYAEVLDKALRCGRGVIFATGHLGNWELMAVALSRRGYPIWTVAKESYDPRFTALIEQERRRFGVRAIFRARPGAAAGMLRALRSGGILGVLIDQDTSVPGVFVPFFGRLAHTPVAAAVLARRTGASLVVGSVYRGRDGRHRIEIAPVQTAGDDTSTTAVLTEMIESRIRRRPSQWVWMHRRWKTRPDEECDERA